MFNLPNILTISRIILTFIYLSFLFSGSLICKYIALFVFIIASLTDLYDGRIARKRNIITNFGKIMDPIADKVLMLASFIAFVGLKIIPAWMVVIIILREFVITGLRLFAVSKNIVLEALKEGKHKTVSQFVAIISILVFLILKDTLIGFDRWSIAISRGFSISITIMMWIVIILTLYSGISFLWKNRRVLS